MGCLCPTDALQYIRHSKASDAPRDAVPSEGAPDAEQNKGGRRRARRPSLAALAEINAGGNIATVARAGAVSPTISGITRQMAGSDAALPGNKGRTRGGGRAPRGTATSEGGGGEGTERTKGAEGELAARASRGRKAEKVWHMIPTRRGVSAFRVAQKYSAGEKVVGCISEQTTFAILVTFPRSVTPAFNRGGQRGPPPLQRRALRSLTKE